MAVARSELQPVRHVAVLVGSLRRDSCNRRVAELLTLLSPRSLRLEIVDISHLGLYREQLDRRPPPAWVLFRQQIRAADGVLFMAPEYHVAVPGVLRNAIEIASHPAGCNAWEGKPGGVISVSATGNGAFSPSHHLRRALNVLNVPLMQRPPTCAANTSLQFDATGELVNPIARRFLEEFLAAFDQWVHGTSRH